jgi:hypothetical protein
VLAPLLLLLGSGVLQAADIADVPVLHVLSALLLMLADAAAMLLLELELGAVMLVLLLQALAAALLYQLACRAWASALERQPLRGQGAHRDTDTTRQAMQPALKGTSTR